MGEELAGVVVNTAAKTPEMIKNVLEMLIKLNQLAAGVTKGIENADAAIGAKADEVGEAVKSLTPSGQVLKAANKAGTEVVHVGGIPAEQKETLKGFCKEQKIPVSFKKAHDGSLTVMYPGNHQAAFTAAMDKTLVESLKAKPNDLEMSRMLPSDAAALKSMLEKEGIDAQFRAVGGEVMCAFQHKDASAVRMLRADCLAAREDIARDFTCGLDPKTGKYFLSDSASGKTTLVSSFKTRDKMESILRERLGYSPEKAQFAAAVFGQGVLSAEARRAYNLDASQVEMLRSMKLDIKRPDDSLLLRGIDFNQINLKGDAPGKERFVVSNGEMAVSLVPASMTRKQMETAVREKLGIADAETVKAVCDKTDLLHRDMISKNAAIGTAGAYKIEKLSSLQFNVGQGEQTQRYSFSDRERTLDAMEKHFGMNREKAEEIFGKAKSQNALAAAVQKAKAISAERASNPPKKQQEIKAPTHHSTPKR